MPETLVQAESEQLLAYPELCFGQPASEKWLDLCSSLRTYQAVSAKFVIDKERKWELVSALQKSIRRADKPTVFQFISRIRSMSEENAYFGSRMCVIVIEDLGTG